MPANAINMIFVSYEALVEGNSQYVAQYKDALFLFRDEEQLEKFMRIPEKYYDIQLPKKLPPVKKVFE